MTAEVAREGLGLQLRVGDHICGFYRQPSERDEILIPFLVEGLKAGDKCTCVVDSCTPGDVLASMSEHIEVDPYVADRQLEVLDAYGTYLADGGFLPERMLRFWEGKARQSPGGERPRPDGPVRARNIGDMSWAHRDEGVVSDLMGYESELNRIMSNFPQVNLCLYDLTRCSGDLIMDVLKTHPKALLGGMVIDNPYYLDPDEFLASRLDRDS
ncbi:MAG: eukaryotic-like serine/threonine-protein kinase [Streptosporangiaceae bacterium]|nr:eukaryotic-like serine/threonine-protein kinase [Streptosporangiaceae bacterium]